MRNTAFLTRSRTNTAALAGLLALSTGAAAAAGIADAGRARGGAEICYSSLALTGDPLDTFSGFIFPQDSNGQATPGGGSYWTLDDIQVAPGFEGERFEQITFSVANANNDGTTSGGSHTFTAQVGLFPDDSTAGGLTPRLDQPLLMVEVSGVVGSFGCELFTIDVSDLAVFKPGEVFWAGLLFSDAGAAAGTGANVNGENFIENFGQGIFGTSTRGFSDNLIWRAPPGGTGLFVSEPPAPWANFGWEFRSVPAPSGAGMLALAGSLLLRRRRA